MIVMWGILMGLFGSLFALMFFYALAFMVTTGIRAAWFGDISKRTRRETDR